MSDSVAIKEAFKAKYINRPIRVVTKNNRKFEGILKAIDFRSNLIIYNATVEIPPEQNCPLNYEISTLADHKLTIQ